jgi:hypothetical protein
MKVVNFLKSTAPILLPIAGIIFCGFILNILNW